MKPSKLLSSDSRGRLRRRPEQIAQLIRDYQRSGLSQVAFCQQRQVPVSSFTFWLRQHRRKAQLQPRRSRRQRPAFRQLDLSPMRSLNSWAAEVVRPDGLIVRLSVHASAQWASELLRVC